MCANFNVKVAAAAAAAAHEGNGNTTISFRGQAPNFLGASSSAGRFGNNVAVAINATCIAPPYTQQFEKFFLLQTSLDVAPTIGGASPNDYAWHVQLPTTSNTTSNTLLTATFCLTESDAPSPSPSTPAPAFSTSNTTKDINSWLAELPPPPSSAHLTDAEVRMYYNAWFQFWFNTERAGGKHWVKPVITPSMSTYARGIWLWDTGFHVFALLTSPGTRALEKAKDQLTVLTTAGRAVGHIPRVVGARITENTTQPPGILTWAALVIYNRTHDAAFLELAYSAFAQNNDWFYAERLAGDGSGLCMWKGEDSGWDTSPRWDDGIVEAIDLNTWLHMDHLLLARMAGILGNATAERMWQQRAEKSAAAVQQWLWDEGSGLFFDRLPAASEQMTRGSWDSEAAGTPLQGGRGPGDFVDVITPAPFWALLGNIASDSQAQSVTAKLLTKDNLLTKYRMPCVGRSEKVFDPTNYWRGPVWVNVNWLASVGLECFGDTVHASMLRNATIAAVNGQPVPREYYNPLTGGGLGAYNFMWTGAVYIVSLQEMAGNFDIANTLHAILKC